MRIVILSDRIPPEDKGGAENVAWAVASGLQRRGHEVHVISGTGGAQATETREGVQVHLLHTRPPVWLRSWFTLYNPRPVRAISRMLRALQPDVVHAHNLQNQLSFGALAAAQRLGIPTVYTAHDFMTFTYGKLTYGIDPEQCQPLTPEQFRLPPLHNLRLMRWRHNPFRTLLIRRVLTQVSQLTCVGETQRMALEANLDLPFSVVHNGIDEQPPASPLLVEQLRTRWGLSTDHRVILFSGRFTREKGSQQLLDVFAQVHSADATTRLLVLTGKNVPAQAGVIAGGWLDRDELRAAYTLAHVATVPSICVEAFGLVTLEAMAASKPVIGSCFGGPAEIIVDGITGYLINPFDVQQFAARLLDVLHDTALARRMGESGYLRWQKQFTLTRQLEQLEKIYWKAQR